MNGQVLVVDDNDVNCMVAETMLKMLGYTVNVAHSGDEACELADDQKYELIFMDWQMPEMNGFEAATKIWAESKFNRETKMIAVTANAFEEAKAECLRHGFVGVLTKPFDVEALTEVIAKTVPLNPN